MIIKFYDTCSLLMKASTLFDDPTEQFVISSVTLEELENIKTSANKDADVKFAARKLVHELDEHYGAYGIIVYQDALFDKYLSNYTKTNDLKILACAIHFAQKCPSDDIIFMTNDLCLKHIARMFLTFVDSVVEEDDGYVGYEEITMSEKEMEYFYQHQQENIYGLCINEYLIVKTSNDDIVDRLCWTGEGYRHLDFPRFCSKWFGEVKPMKDDIYQLMAADSLNKNQITLIKGPAGSGKTYLSLGFLMSKLEKHQIDKIIVFCNTVATKNSAKLGYYPGTRDEKLLDSQIGNLLISKFGGRVVVEQMIQEEKLVLLPLSDIRGYDTTGMNAGIYISEAQNLDIELMKLTLQRIGEDSICIIDGDEKAQVDDVHFAGASNGMRRVSKLFRGHDIYGEVRLQNIHRSKIAQIAEDL